MSVLPRRMRYLLYVKLGLLQMSGLQPSNSPIRSTVAELDWGGVHCEETRAALTRAAARVLYVRKAILDSCRGMGPAWKI